MTPKLAWNHDEEGFNFTVAYDAVGGPCATWSSETLPPDILHRWTRRENVFRPHGRMVKSLRRACITLRQCRADLRAILSALKISANPCGA